MRMTKSWPVAAIATAALALSACATGGGGTSEPAAAGGGSGGAKTFPQDPPGSTPR